MIPHSAEWLEADGLGGFAFGRVDGIRTRRYHGVLTVATAPPTGRVMLVNGYDAWIEIDGARVALSSQRYVPDVTHPDGASRLVDFTTEPWPAWTYALPNGLEIVHELVVMRGRSIVALAWRLSQPARARLVVRPFLSGRDIHATHHENDAFRFEADVSDGRVRWHPYSSAPRITARTNGTYEHAPVWYRQFQYDEERARGLDFVEDLASPGSFTFDLTQRATIVLAADGSDAVTIDAIERAERQRRASYATRLDRSADDFIVRRGSGQTIIAGYPWFTDWGRDTFIALRGLCLSSRSPERLAVARDILLEWAGHVSEGMLPNYFPEAARAAEYNSVDASLWFVVAVHELLSSSGSADAVSAAQRSALLAAIDAIVAGYTRGTRHGIRAEPNGLLRAGEAGVQLTWMDAKVGDWVVTPRIGKPVEIQALWINALRIAGLRSAEWNALADRVQGSFVERFWNHERGCLIDVVDVDHQEARDDALLRPNQIFAVGGLPYPILDRARARAVVDVVERELWTPAGLRSLGAREPGYIGRYEGDVRSRDGAYHQGTVWPWLTGAFVDAWLRIHGDTPERRGEARARFLDPLLEHYTTSAPGYVGEIADGDAPHTPHGCPFQAWSVGEAIRLRARLSD